MTSPKNIRNAILGAGLAGTKAGGLAAANSPPPAAPERKSAEGGGAPGPQQRVGAGAVGAVSRSLSRFDEELREAKRLASGERVVEIAPDLIDPSFVRDRLEPDDAAHRALVASIAEGGQQVPVLVRPHPTQAGRYQIAYGHRRLAAAAELGRPVRAVVRPLTDAELLVAQGQENSARSDLSFIERASFAQRLLEGGLPREAAMGALSIDKTELSKLLAVAKAVPAAVVGAIGPAPKAGRTRWLGLAEALKDTEARARVEALAATPDFAALPTDERFVRALVTARPRQAAPSAKRVYTASDQGSYVEAEPRGRAMHLTIDGPDGAAFAEHLLAQLPQLFASFRARKPS